MKIDVPVRAYLLLGFHHHLKELLDLEVVVLFVNHVEALHHIVVALGVDDTVKHRLDVWFADNLKSAVDDLHLEEGEQFLYLLLDPVENSEFFL